MCGVDVMCGCDVWCGVVWMCLMCGCGDVGMGGWCCDMRLPSRN
jgi:hypothetical protein